jgi:hypothetical protein
MSDDYLFSCSQEIRQEEAAKNRAVAAGLVGLISGPVAIYKSVEHNSLAFTYWKQGNNLIEYSEKNPDLEQSVAQRDYAGVNYNAAAKEAGVGFAWALVPALVVGALLRSRKKHNYATKAAHEERISLQHKMVHADAKFEE